MGRLYVVATPIGNLEDITIRAIKILLTTEIIVCEDTRRTGQLIKILKDRYEKILNFNENISDVKHTFISVRDWNEADKVAEVLSYLELADLALVSDAGTPLLSDPGFKLVRDVLKAGYKVIPIPGPFAGVAALSASGLPTDKVIFLGFIHKNIDLQKGYTHIIYESPKRVNKTVTEIKTTYPESEIVIAREITKVHEYIGVDDGKTLKGEVTLLVRI